MNKVQNWHKAFLLLFIGIPITLLLFLGVYSFLTIPKNSLLNLLIIICIFTVFGLAGGYIAKDEYIKTGLSFVFVIYLMLILLGTLFFIIGPGMHTLEHGGGFPWDLVIQFILILCAVGIIISLVIFLLLIPSLTIGSKIQRMKLVD